MNEEQAGFFKIRRLEEHLLILELIINKAKKKSKYMACTNRSRKSFWYSGKGRANLGIKQNRIRRHPNRKNKTLNK